MWNRKQANELKAANARVRELEAQRDYLIGEIRRMDQIIFNMSKQTSWANMRPAFSQLVDEMTARKVAESKRINDLVMGEVIDTYRQPSRVMIEDKR